MSANQSLCWECKKPLAARVASNGQVAKFCGTACRRAFGNRRAVRGAQAYDLIAAMRDPVIRAREDFKELGIWTALCQLELGWREEDEREGRAVRYIPPKEAIGNLVDSGKLPRGELLTKKHQVGRRA